MVGSMGEVAELDHFIGGRTTAGARRFDVRDPGRFSEIVASVADADAADVEEAVQAAALAAGGWGARSLSSRTALLEAALQGVESQIDDLAEVLSRENGGTLFESSMDLSRGVALFRDFLTRADRVLGDQTTDNEQHRLVIEHRPIGVVALIVPWNSPVVLTISKLAPALIAGNTVIVKPSVLAPVAVGRVLQALGERLPEGVIGVVHGDAEVGTALVASAQVRKVSFTGSVGVGKQIMAGAAANVKRVSLELGGNDAAILLDDVDLAESVPLLAKGIFTRAGQVCFAVKRVYVPRSRHDEVIDALMATVDAYRVGHGLDDETTFGPLISAAARTRVEGLVERAAADGAKIHELAKPTSSVDWDGGHYMLPMVATGVAPDSELVSVEQFGPVIPVVAYDTVDQAVAMANGSEFGLCSSVWSQDVERAFDVARRIEAGATFINSHNVSSLSFDMPFGGVKQSGIGRERTDLGFLEYVETHAIRLGR
jgi:acyl-CoA reductase-like NAD-dependent aldehyde dehydrogenase